MKRLLALIAGFGLCFGVAAQQYKWVDQNGRTQYGDNPPPGVKATPLRAPAAGPATADPASKGPGRTLSPSEQEAEYRKRQLEAKKASDKSSAVEKEAAMNRENCLRAQEYLRSLESGQRQTRVDSKGERYYLEDAEIAQETAKARQTVQQICS